MEEYFHPSLLGPASDRFLSTIRIVRRPAATDTERQAATRHLGGAA
jgi:hypothetical protein